jgi:hypothetical protein
MSGDNKSGGVTDNDGLNEFFHSVYIFNKDKDNFSIHQMGGEKIMKSLIKKYKAGCL